MKPEDRYLKIVEWSEEDQCYVGRCPELMLGGVHGDDEVKVYRELSKVIQEWVKIHQQEGRPLPEPSLNRNYTGKFIVRLPAELHERLAIKAAIQGSSLNQLIKQSLERSL
jgi:predicted HicB family RNase H-like nuclease